jgi:hypothetical protein
MPTILSRNIFIHSRGKWKESYEPVIDKNAGSIIPAEVNICDLPIWAFL